jgi:hypothetical protein
VVGATLASDMGAIVAVAGPALLPLALGVGFSQLLQIESSRAEPAAIASGRCSRRAWGAGTGASNPSSQTGIGEVNTPGSQIVCPAGTTSHRLTTTNTGGTTYTTGTVTVARSFPPPEEWDPRLDDLGVRLEVAGGGEDVPHRQAVKARWAAPDEAAGLHHIFLELRGASRQPLQASR